MNTGRTKLQTLVLQGYVDTLKYLPMYGYVGTKPNQRIHVNHSKGAETFLMRGCQGCFNRNPLDFFLTIETASSEFHSIRQSDNFCV